MIVRVSLLGPVEVYGSDGRRIELTGPRLRAVIAQLALSAGRPVSADRLIDGIWGSTPPAGAVNALQALVSRLRRTLPPADAQLISAGAGGYQLAVDPAQVDAAVFERLASKGRAALTAARASTATPPGGANMLRPDRASQAKAGEAAAVLRDALGLWRGPALSDLEDAPFARAPATRLDELRAAALEDRIEADLRLGRHVDVVAELESLVAEHPLRERLAGQLIRALYGAGRQADALAAYGRIRGILADNLGIDPSPELEQTYLAVLRQEPALLPAATAAEPTAGARTNLRARLTSFVGRGDDVPKVQKLVTDYRLVTLVGPGGAGKTRLAEESASGLFDQMPDGVWMVDLAPVSDPLEVPHAVLDATGLGELSMIEQPQRGVLMPGRPGIVARLAAAAAGRKMLLILDNCEHLIEPAAQLAEDLLATAPELRVLATSREPLGISGESLFPVAPLALPPPGAGPDDAAGFASVRLLLDRASAVRPDFALGPATTHPVVEVCRRLDGLPLAIELAAARLRSMPIGEIAERLGDRFRLLTGGSRTALPRHRTLAAVVEWSWDLLDETERTVASRLSVFAGGASLTATEQVCAGGTVVADNVVDILGSLVEKSLVVLSSDAPTRYRMLETIRAFAADRLAEAGEADEVRNAHAAHFLALAERAESELRSSRQLQWLPWLRTEEDNLLAALRWAIDSGDALTAVRMVVALGWPWIMRGAEGSLTWIRDAVSVPGELPADLSAEANALLSLAYGMTDDLPSGRAVLDKALKLADTVPFEKQRVATVLAGPFFAMFDLDHDTAFRGAQRLTEHPNRWIHATGLLLAGYLLLNDGDIRQGEERVEAARAEFEAIGEHWGMANATSALAELRATRGDSAGAFEAREIALQLATEVGAKDDIVGEHVRLAVLRARAGDLDGADKEMARAFEARTLPAVAAAHGGADTSLGGIDMEVYLQNAAGEVAWIRGDRSEARARLNRALALCEQTNLLPRQIRAVVQTSLARVNISEGDLATAAELLADAARAGVEAKDMPVAASALDAGATLALARDEPQRAARLLGLAEALRGIPDHGNPEAVRAGRRAAAELGAEAYDRVYASAQNIGRDAAAEEVRAGTPFE